MSGMQTLVNTAGNRQCAGVRPAAPSPTGSTTEGCGCRDARRGPPDVRHRSPGGLRLSSSDARTCVMEALGVLAAVCLFVVVLAVLAFSRLYRKVDQSQALIVSKTRRVDVSFTGQVVLPILHKA